MTKTKKRISEGYEKRERFRVCTSVADGAQVRKNAPNETLRAPIPSIFSVAVSFQAHHV